MLHAHSFNISALLKSLQIVMSLSSKLVFEYAVVFPSASMLRGSEPR